MEKAETAFRTISEVSAELGIAQHILRYWETRFPQLRPLQRAGNRRYYRVEDIALLRRIDTLLNHEGYTIKGVQQVLAARPPKDVPVAPPPSPAATRPADQPGLTRELEAIRDALEEALR